MPGHWDQSDSWTTDTNSNGRAIVFFFVLLHSFQPFFIEIDFDENILKLIYACVRPVCTLSKASKSAAAIEIICSIIDFM